MKKILFLTIIAMSFILFGCNKQELIEENKQSEIPEPVEENKQPEIPVIDWTHSRDPNQPTCVEDEVWFIVKKEYKDKIITSTDFPMLDIRKIERDSESDRVKNIYPNGNIPELYYYTYCIYLKNKGEQLVYSAVEAIQDLEFIEVAYPNVYCWLA